MEVLIVLVPFVLAGLVVIFIAFSGGPGAAREAYLTRGGRFFTISILLLYLALGVVVPAAVIAGRGEAEGGTGSLRTEELTAKEEDGQELFIQTCKSCHTLEAVHAHGVTGPNLDELGRARQAARPQRDRARRHRHRPDAARPARGRGRRRRGHLRGRPSPAADPARPEAPFASLVAFSPQAPGFSVRRIRSGASMAASSKPKPREENGAWGTQVAGRSGANRRKA